MIKIPVDAPKAMLDFARSEQAKEKPYDLCLLCPFMGTSCDGPNILAMEYPRWVEWANDRAKKQKMTRGEIAAIADLPKSTVDSALSGKLYDTRSETMRKITKAIVGGCWGQYPCHLASLLMEGNAESDTQEAIDKEKLRWVQEESEKKISYLKRIVDDLQESIKWYKRSLKWHKIMICIFAGISLIFMIWLIIDLATAGIGWFR